jgi:SAM-dependent methyltransferase
VSGNASQADDSADRADGQGADRARRYAQHVAPTFVTLARRAVDLAEIETGNSVLDLYAATGLAAFLAAERASRDGSVVGLDPSPHLLDVARERSASVGYEFISWQEGDPAQLTFADESFDAVLCIQALTTVARPDAVLEEARRVLVEGGRLVVTLWGARAFNDWMALVDDALRRSGGLPAGAPARPTGLSQPGNLEVLLQAAGLTDIEVARVPDRMRLQGVEGFWEWCRASGIWGSALDTLAPAARDRAVAALERTLGPDVREGELAVNREIVYARAIAPPSY